MITPAMVLKEMLATTVPSQTPVDLDIIKDFSIPFLLIIFTRALQSCLLHLQRDPQPIVQTLPCPLFPFHLPSRPLSIS